MQFSRFGQQFTGHSGILQLMDDLGDALSSDAPVNMLGGGNPARIDAVNAAFLEIYRILGDSHDGSGDPAIENIGNYSNPQGDAKFIAALVDFFNRHYDWQLTSDHIALTNGSQNAFFYLFNLFAGQFDDADAGDAEAGKAQRVDKSILLPLAPEYIGYSDVHIEGEHFVAVQPQIDEVTHEGETGFFKYRVDFAALNELPELQQGKIGAICCSRPTNPTGNVLTDEEMQQLSELAKTHGIPLIVDNAYGMPFPNIIYSDATLSWDDNTILCLSLSKIGLPGVRTGIIIACPEVIAAVSAMNAIINLAPTRFGAAIATPLLHDDRLKQLSDHEIRPFYQAKARRAVSLLKHELGDYPMRIHKPEGAIFLWVWFADLPISTLELYGRLKQQNTLIIPSEHFFPGIDTDRYPHAHECIRISIAQDDATLVNGIAVIGEVVRALYDS